jgi:glycosyltransferase involved in cell wall biosynthesis
MRVGLEAHELLIAGMSGVGRYVFELGRHLRAIDPQAGYVLPLSRLAKHHRIRRNGISGMRYVGTHWPFPRFDILHLTAGKSMRVRGAPPIILTVHDLWEFHEIARGERTGHSNANRRLLELLRIADGVICVSRSTHADLARFFPDLRIPRTVVHHGVSELFTRSTAAEIASCKARHLPKLDEYLLYVGHFHPRKNIPGLLAGYAAVPGPRPPLVLAGNQNQELRTAMATHARKLGIADHELIQLGYLPNEDLAPLISGARGVIFVPLFEGFGLPLVEAYRCGIPVVCGGNSSLIELAHPDSPVVDVTEPQDIARGIQHLVAKPVSAELRHSLIAHGESFSWARCAKETMAFYRQVLAEMKIQPN